MSRAAVPVLLTQTGNKREALVAAKPPFTQDELKELARRARNADANTYGTVHVLTGHGDASSAWITPDKQATEDDLKRLVRDLFKPTTVEFSS